MNECDIVILSNGPGELTTWVRPVVKTIRELLGEEREKTRISVILSPCPNGTGKEGAIARSFPQVDRVLEEKDFFSFLLFGKTPEDWDWRTQGIVLFLGGDQFYTVVISKRLKYKSVIYAEWEARWWQFIDHFALMQSTLINNIPQRYKNKCTVVGDLMQNAAENLTIKENNTEEIIGLLPGSKAAKLAQGVPFFLAIAVYINQKRPQTKFIIPVAPTLDINTLGKFADLSYNPVIKLINGITAKILVKEEKAYLETETGLKVELITEYPVYDKIAECKICVTTVGANTAELGSLAIPMIVIILTQQLDAMKSWDGLPGILANLPGIGGIFAKIINSIVLKQGKLFAWPNIWAKKEIVPELVGNLQVEEVGELIIDYLENPDKLREMSENLRQVRGESGAALKIAQIIASEMSII